MQECLEFTLIQVVGKWASALNLVSLWGSRQSSEEIKTNITFAQENVIKNLKLWVPIIRSR